MGKDSKKFKFFDAEARAERFKDNMKGGYLSRSDLERVVNLDGGIPDYAKEEVIKLALKK